MAWSRAREVSDQGLPFIRLNPVDGRVQVPEATRLVRKVGKPVAHHTMSVYQE